MPLVFMANAVKARRYLILGRVERSGRREHGDGTLRAALSHAEVQAAHGHSRKFDSRHAPQSRHASVPKRASCGADMRRAADEPHARFSTGVSAAGFHRNQQDEGHFQADKFLTPGCG